MSGATIPAPQASARNAWIARVALLGVLAGLLGLYFLDRRAGYRCAEAYQRLNLELAPLKSGSRMVTAERVVQLVGFAPQESDEPRQQEHFYFASPTRRYRLTVEYAGGARSKLAQQCRVGVGAPAL